MPQTHGDLINRSCVTTKFDELLHKELAIVCAPPGYGKTTAVKQWLSNRRHNYCWFSIDSRDNDPGTFWRYLCTSLSSVGTKGPNDSMTRYDVIGSKDIDAAIDTLVDDLVDYSRTWKSSGQLILVLDDYHLIHNTTINEQLCRFIDYCPGLLKVVITCRHQPSLTLPKRRIRNQLVEISREHLQFNQADCQKFLATTFSLNLNEQNLAVLHKKTEGWIGAIHLAGLALQNRANKTQFIEQFSGKESSLSSYLLSEVFEQQPSLIQNLLLRASTIPRLCASLCRAIMGQEHGQLLINELKQKNLFVIPLDDEEHWFRLHDLFRDWLIKQFIEGPQTDILEVRTRAAHWFEEQELYLEAVEQIIEIKDWQWASLVAGKIMPALIKSGDYLTCEKLCKPFPDNFIKTQPKLCSLQAFAHFYNEKYSSAQQLLHIAEQQLIKLQKEENISEYLNYGLFPNEDINELITELLIYRNQFYRYNGQIDLSIPIPKEELTKVIQSSPTINSWMLHEIGFQQLTNNQLIDAESNLIKSIQTAKVEHNRLCIMISFSWLISILYQQGKIDSGLQLIDELETWLATSPQALFPYSGILDFGYSVFYCEKNLKNEAISAHNSAVAKWGGKIDPTNQIYVTFQKVLLDLSFGTTTDALKTLDEVDRIYHRYFSEWRFNLPTTNAMRAIIQLISGNPEELYRWAEAFEKSKIIESSLRNEDEALFYTRALLMQGQDIRPLTQDIRKKAIEGNVLSRVIQCWILEAFYFGLKNEKVKSFAAFRKALKLGARTGFIRVFLAEGPEIKPLLKAAIKFRVENSYAKKLLLQFDEPKTTSITIDTSTKGTTSLVEQLSNREIQVLKLINDGNSNKTISIALNVAPTTVKTHVQNIYSKLGVNRRTQALASAREYGIL